MGLLGPKEGVQGGAQGSPPNGLYKQRGAPKTPILATIHAREQYREQYLSIRSATLLSVRVDFAEVLRLLHKDEPFVRWFAQLHCQLPSSGNPVIYNCSNPGLCGRKFLFLVPHILTAVSRASTVSL